MRHFIFFLLLLTFLGKNSFAQKMNGFGGEINLLGINLDDRFWTSKTHGFEVFGGMASGMEDLKMDDVSAGFKYLHGIQYRRQDRTYFGIVGKWKWIDVFDSNSTTSLPVGGVLLGKEWYTKRIHRKAYAIEFGYQYGKKTFTVTDPNGLNARSTTYTEFPLIINLRYSFYQLR